MDVVTRYHARTSQQHTPHGRGLHYSGVNSHDAEVLRSRAIPPDVARECGFHTARGAMQIPHYDIAGDVWTVQRRPHMRREGAPKYLFDKGTRMGLHIPPPSRQAIHDVTIPLILTESALKAAAIIAALRRHGLQDAYCVVSIPGVTTWRTEDAPIGDFGDFPCKIKKQDKIVYRRKMVIAFDSNAATNPKVALARWDLTDHLRRVRKLDMQWIDVPEGTGATVKEREQGIDDAIRAGCDIRTMLAGAYRAPDRMPLTALPTPDDDAPEIERLRAENARLREERGALLASLTNPYIKPSIKQFMAAAYVEVTQQTPDAEGYVEVEARRASGDWRKETPRGTPAPKLNPDGSRPLMARSAVKSAAREAMELGIFHATEMPKDKKHDGRAYVETVWRIKQPANMAEFLAGLATFERPGVAPRKNRSQTPICPACGERHDRRIETTCMGCGEIIDTKIVDAIELTAADVDAATEPPISPPQTQPEKTPGKISGEIIPPPSPVAPSQDVSPDILFADQPAPAADSSSSLWDRPAAVESACHNCKAPLPPANKTGECATCTAHFQRLNDERWRHSA